MKEKYIMDSVSDFIFDDEIESIIELEEDELLDIEVSHNHLFFANDILTKNSVGLPATVDFLAVLGRNEDDAIYQSEIWYKILKNRLGGRVGTMDHFYIDQKSLKLYDSTELDKFLQEASITGDTRDIIQR